MNAGLEALAWYFVFLFSVTVHEAAHAYAAKRGGDLTAYFGGQVSLDPMPHIRREPFGMVVLPLLSLVFFQWPFGYASTPYDPVWAQAHPRRAAWMSLAGPASNLALVLVAAVGIRVGVEMGVFYAPESVAANRVVASVAPGLGEAVAFLLGLFFCLNLILFLFNLLPVPPLDGSGALPLVLPAALAARYQNWMRQPMLAVLGILLAWNVFGSLFGPVFRMALNLLYPGAGYH